MSGEIARGGPGRDPEVGSGELSPYGGFAELTVLARISALQPLSPIPDDVPAEIRVFAETLRVLFGALGMSLNRLAALLHSDPGTVSRYLSGKRIPPPGFIDGLCKAVYDAKGSLVTEQVHELVHEQFLVALRAHNPARFEVQRLSDLLQVAAQEKQQYEITVAALEEAIASRNDKIYELELEGRQLRSAWARTEGLFEEEKKHRERLQQAMDSLYTEVSTLKARLVSVQRRAAAAEERCWELEAQLDSAGARLPDEERGTTTPGPARGAAALPPRPQSPAPGKGRASDPPAVPHERGLRALEEAAQLIRTYAVQSVPSLLQTEEYARAVILQGWPGHHPNEVERRIAVRISRQKLLTREHPPRYWAIVQWRLACADQICELLVYGVGESDGRRPPVVAGSVVARFLEGVAGGAPALDDAGVGAAGAAGVEVPFLRDLGLDLGEELVSLLRGERPGQRPGGRCGRPW
jgi:transcriptional regulator with XRE-family HTH domain